MYNQYRFLDVQIMDFQLKKGRNESNQKHRRFTKRQKNYPF